LIKLLQKLAQHTRILRGFGVIATALVFLFLIDNILIYVFDWPGLRKLFAHHGLASAGNAFKGLEGAQIALGWGQLIAFVTILAATILWVRRTDHRSLNADANLYSSIAAFIVRAAFWAVLLVGAVDMLIYYPLIAAAIVIASFSRSLGFIWLSLMIVSAEFLIVITRFVFSYEQAFMGDLVRFWYAAMFLFASAYTLMHDGHVRVDVLYAGFTDKGKAVTNTLGALLLGLPLCWTILILGTASKGSIINSPLLSFEISQSGFGMYTKYLMAAYLMVFAISMAVQFVSFFLSNMAQFTDSADHHITEAS